MSVLRAMRELAALLAHNPIPAPHGIHLNYPARDETWVRRLAADPAIAGQVGLTPRLMVGPTQTLSGVQGVEVRLSWFNDDAPIERGRAASALRVLVDLAACGDMPEPRRVDAMCALRSVGNPARLLVREAALALGVRPVEGDGQVLMTRWVASGVSYTVHGFLR